MAKAIMIQGTMSNAGKSLLAAGLCRIFRQDGYSVAPFKSQNMALNSFVTKEGLEMGRAQVVQALSCGKEPSVLMNPILLKPTTDMGSQVIVNGEVVGNMRAMDYFRKKKEYIPVIRAAYEKLAAENDIIVIEGAGSPAEINLKQDDIVNMGMAKMADAPVLLVGDIDRGGVFAQLLGTVWLLEEDEQERIKGLIINKFRGDKKILEPGLEMITARCGKKVLGVVPYFQDIDIEEEDSLAESLLIRRASGAIDVAVIRLPKLSNFTDFQALAAREDVSVRYVTRPSELGTPDLICLPGTKSTIEDMKWMRESGLEAAVLRQANAGTPIIGICGGFQLLGEQIRDGNGVEGGSEIRGMGLLPICTEFEPEKARRQSKGKVGEITGLFEPLSGLPIEGYEIHMGRSFFRTRERKEGNYATKLQGDGAFRPDGWCRGNVFGTYLHGLFDSEEFTERLLNLLAKRKGIERMAKGFSMEEYREAQFDKLAAGLRESLDMDEIYRILNLPGRR